jgi:hypothetical protein
VSVKPFIPSSGALLAMISRAEAKFDADREQCALRKEAREEARAVQAWVAQTKARHYRRIQDGNHE